MDNTKLYNTLQELDECISEIEADTALKKEIDIFEFEHILFLLDNISSTLGTLKLNNTEPTSKKPDIQQKFSFPSKILSRLLKIIIDRVKHYQDLFLSTKSYETFETHLILVIQTVSILEYIEKLPKEYFLLKAKLTKETPIHSAILTFEIKRGIFKQFLKLKENIRLEKNTLQYFFLLFKELKRFIELDARMFRNAFGDFLDNLDSTKLIASMFWKETSREVQEFVESFKVDEREENYLNPKLWLIFYEDFSSFFSMCSSFDDSLKNSTLKKFLEPLLSSFVKRLHLSATKTATIILEKDITSPINDQRKHSASVIELFKYLLPKFETLLRFPLSTENLLQIVNVLHFLMLNAFKFVEGKFFEMAKKRDWNSNCFVTLINNLVVLEEKFEETVLFLDFEKLLLETFSNVYFSLDPINLKMKLNNCLHEIDEYLNTVKRRFREVLNEMVTSLLSNRYFEKLEKFIVKEISRETKVENDSEKKLENILEEVASILANIENSFVQNEELENDLFYSVYKHFIRVIVLYIEKQHKNLGYKELTEIEKILGDIEILFKDYDFLSDKKLSEIEERRKLKDLIIYYKQGDDKEWIRTMIKKWLDENSNVERSDNIFPYNII